MPKFLLKSGENAKIICLEQNNVLNLEREIGERKSCIQSELLAGR